MKHIASLSKAGNPEQNKTKPFSENNEKTKKKRLNPISFNLTRLNFPPFPSHPFPYVT